jgi:ABC-type molybdate transport system ATPase subunit
MIYVSHQAADIRRIAAAVVRVEAGQVKATGGLELLDAADADAVR